MNPWWGSLDADGAVSVGYENFGFLFLGPGRTNSNYIYNDI